MILTEETVLHKLLSLILKLCFLTSIYKIKEMVFLWASSWISGSRSFILYPVFDFFGNPLMYYRVFTTVDHCLYKSFFLNVVLKPVVLTIMWSSVKFSLCYPCWPTVTLTNPKLTKHPIRWPGFNLNRPILSLWLPSLCPFLSLSFTTYFICLRRIVER